MTMNRREVLVGAAAITAAAALPAATPAAPVAGAMAPEPGWWGFSIDDEHWCGPFDSREQALAAAIDEADGYYAAVETGRCIPIDLHIPDLRDDVINWLAEDATGGYWWRPDALGDFLVQEIEGANQDADFEGELSDAFARVDTADLTAAAHAVLDAALMRLGRPDLINLSRMTDDRPPLEDEALLDALGADDLLGADLRVVAEKWATAHDLMDAPRALTVRQQQTHPVSLEETP